MIYPIHKIHKYRAMFRVVTAEERHNNRIICVFDNVVPVVTTLAKQIKEGREHSPGGDPVEEERTSDKTLITLTHRDLTVTTGHC